MKFEWEHFDIRAGRQVQSENRLRTFVISWAAWLEGDDRWCLVDLSDGMIVNPPESKNDMMFRLNASQARPVDIRPDDVAGSGA